MAVEFIDLEELLLIMAAFLWALTALTLNHAFNTFGGVDSEKIFSEDGLELNFRDTDLMASVDGLGAGDDVEFFLEVEFGKF